MPGSLPQANAQTLLNNVRKPVPAKANLDENDVRTSARLLRKAIERTGMTQDQAMEALGFRHKGDFSEALDGIRKLWAHQLLRPKAASIRKQLLILSALADGSCEVESVIRIRERA